MTRGSQALVLGLGVTGTAVARALVRAGATVVVIEDHPRPEHRATAESLGVSLVEAPSPDALPRLARGLDVAYPSPGIPDAHPLFAALAEAEVPVRSEFDLARELDDRPVVAITGTDGKTTVTTMVTDMLLASGTRAASVGNTETPLVTAIEDERIDVFVVEASSFRLGHTHRFVPSVATWLNFGPDHQDVHRSPEAYEAAKARLWADLGSDQLAVANAEDPVVMRHLRAEVPSCTFGASRGDFHVVDGRLVGGGDDLLGVDELSRSLPHDISNALAAAATARGAGAAIGAVRSVLAGFTHLAHRVEFVAEVDGVAYYDDSKATTPHATIAAAQGFDPIVLLAGGRNKGLDLGVLRSLAPRLRAVVALGDAARDVVDAFDGLVPTTVAESMASAVAQAAAAARPGDTVLLSPACASFDWYGSYGERGDDFAAAVKSLGAHEEGPR